MISSSILHRFILASNTDFKLDPAQNSRLLLFTINAGILGLNSQSLLFAKFKCKF